jgi:hypothetical protein
MKMLGFARPIALGDVPAWTVRPGVTGVVDVVPTVVDLRAGATEPTYAEASVITTAS